MFTFTATWALCINTYTHNVRVPCARPPHGTKLWHHNTENLTSLQARLVSGKFQNWPQCVQERRCKYIHNFGTGKWTECPVGGLFITCQGNLHILKIYKLPDTTFKMAVLTITTATDLTFRHRASCILGQAFHYSPENAFYIFNQQIYFIIWYLLDRASLI